MKILKKIFLTFFIFNLIIVFLSLSLIFTSSLSTKINFSDLIKNRSEAEKIVEKKVIERASQLGKETGKNLAEAIGNLILGKDYSHSLKNQTENDLCSIEELLQSLEDNSKKTLNLN